MDIQGKVFIVTGGASGLGEGTARMLAAQGGRVVIADMQADKGEAVAREIGGTFVRCDVTSEADGQAVVAQAVAQGKLMGLVNCAGIAPAEKTVGKNGAHGLALFAKTVTVNLIGSFNMIRLAAEAMSRNEPEATGERGVLISTASIAAREGDWRLAARMLAGARGTAPVFSSPAGVALYRLTVPQVRAAIDKPVRDQLLADAQQAGLPRLLDEAVDWLRAPTAEGESTTPSRTGG